MWHEGRGLWREAAGGLERSRQAFLEDGARLAGASRNREDLRRWESEENVARSQGVPRILAERA